MTFSRKTTISTTILSVNLVGMERKRKIGIDDDYNDEQGDHFSPGSTRLSSPSWQSCGVSPLVSPFSSSEWLHVELMRLMRLMKYNSKKKNAFNISSFRHCVDEDEREGELPPKLLESPINTLLRLSAPGGADLLLIDQHIHHHNHHHHYHPYSLCHQHHHYWCQDPYRIFKIIITIMSFSAQP